MACAELSNHPVFWGIDHDEALIRKGEKERAVQPEYVPYLMELSTNLFNLSTHRSDALKELIQELDIDKWSRLARQNDFNEEVAEYNKKVSRLEGKKEEKEEKEDKYLERLDRLYRHNKGIIFGVAYAVRDVSAGFARYQPVKQSFAFPIALYSYPGWIS